MEMGLKFDKLGEEIERIETGLFLDALNKHSDE